VAVRAEEEHFVQRCEQRRRERQQAARGTGRQLAAVGVVVIIAAAVIVLCVSSSRKRRQRYAARGQRGSSDARAVGFLVEDEEAQAIDEDRICAKDRHNLYETTWIKPPFSPR
jgi:hypothetical protein